MIENPNRILKKAQKYFGQNRIVCGANVGEGWVELVLSTFEAIKNELLMSSTKGFDSNFAVAQVKEKFGGLRLYYDLETEDTCLSESIRSLVDTAESTSFKLCEECGTLEGVSSSDGWAKTLCVEHHKERNKRLNNRG